MINNYREALKIGNKTYQENIKEGKSGSLTVLENLVSSDDIAKEEYLGVMDIPLDLVVGTKSQSRAFGFASDFMPLLPANSEFASKWSLLEDDLSENGQRDPITCIEFLNKYYVIEGNKRTSVSKFLGGVAISAEVRRYIPKDKDDEVIQTYFEYLDFYEVTGINYLYFRKKGNYQKLINLIYNGEWDDRLKAKVKSLYYRFTKLYTSDNKSNAYLTLVELWGFNTLYKSSENELKKYIEQSIGELKASGNDQSISYQTETLNTKDNFFNFLTNFKKSIKVGFIYPKKASESAWIYPHELGRLHISKEFENIITTEAFEDVKKENIKDLVIKMIDDGFKVIFFTTPIYNDLIVNLAVTHPEVLFFVCSINQSHPSLNTYYARMYELKFIEGAVAASLSNTNKITYVADYPVYGTMANINSFVLGARFIKPNIKVQIEWQSRKGDIKESIDNFGSDIVSSRDDIIPSSTVRNFGLIEISKDKTIKDNLLLPIYRWDQFYEMLIKAIINGNFKNDKEKAANIFLGLESGVLELIESEKIPNQTKQLIKLLIDSIQNKTVRPFTGPIKDIDGKIVCEKDSFLRAKDIAKIDWLIEGVEGSIPSVKDLKGDIGSFIASQGVPKALKKMRILCLADEESRSLYDYFTPDKLKDIDLIISCGDLKPKYLSFLVTMAKCPLIYVHGNHDEIYDIDEPEGCDCIDDKIYEYKGLRIMGLGSSLTYNGGKYQCSESKMTLRIAKLALKSRKGVDIIVTHAPIAGVNDMEDLAHKGFECFKGLITRYQPEYFLHGHVHMSYGHQVPRITEIENTKVVNCYEKYIIEI